MIINVNDHGIFPNGEERTNIWLWTNRSEFPDDPDRTDVPVWLALQILLNRATRNGGTVYLPAIRQEMRAELQAGNLPSYNIGIH